MNEKISLENFLSEIGQKNERGIIDFSQKFPALVFFFNDKSDTRYRGVARFIYVQAERVLMIVADRLAILKLPNWEDIDSKNSYIEIPLNLEDLSVEEGDQARLYRIKSPARRKHVLLYI